MSQARTIIQAFRVKAALGRLARAKENALRAMAGLPPLRTWYEECYIGCMKGLRTIACKVCCSCCAKPRLKRIPDTCCGRMFTSGTYENEVLKNFLGCLGGLVLSFTVFLLMALHMRLPLVTCAITSAVVGLFLSLGLAFSDAIRCIVLLMIPSFFSSKGRAFLLMYCTILVLSHPVVNFNHNILVMSESATCGQNIAHNETQKLLNEALSPISAILDGVREMIRAIRRFSDTIRQAFLALRRAVQEISEAIGRVLAWIGSLVNICNENMGAPYKRCRNSFNEAVTDCRNRLGIFKFLCEIVSWVSEVCHVARVGELFCLVTSAIAEHVGSTIGKPVKSVLQSVYDMFYFNITIDYHYNLSMSQSKTYGEVKEDIMSEIKAVLNRINAAINISDHMLTLSIIMVVVKAVLYRHKYLTKDRYDNIFITKHVWKIDSLREELGKGTILPLTPSESTRYGPAGTTRLFRGEKVKMARGLIMWMFSAGHGYFYIMCDYGLFWLLNLIRVHFEIKTNAAIPPHTKLHVQGQGAMADMYRALIGVFDPLTEANLDIDTTHCLPNPSTPNFTIYKTVATIYSICLIMSIFEGYALRLRHVISACHYPKREEKRAVWLYNHVMVMRGGFLKFARRRARRKYANDNQDDYISIRSRIIAQCPCLGGILKYFGYEQSICLLCGQEGNKDSFQRCDSGGCEAVYCTDCFATLQNTCGVCMNPTDYGNASDVSEEQDSSEDEEEMTKKNERIEELKKRKAEGTASRLLLNLKTALSLSSSSTSSSDEEEDHEYQYERNYSDFTEGESEESSFSHSTEHSGCKKDYVSSDFFTSEDESDSTNITDYKDEINTIKEPSSLSELEKRL